MPEESGRLPMSDIYEQIAEFYEIDMGRNMDLDDTAFWLQGVAHIQGPVLELGCGTGRITRRLAQAGLDIVSVDRAGAMLVEFAKTVAPTGSVAAIRADIRALPFVQIFDAVMCPYSLITSMLTDADLSRTLEESRRVLKSDGLLFVDAFFPRVEIYTEDYVFAYKRPWGENILERWQRVAPAGGGINRVDRSYRVTTPQGRQVRRIETSEYVRPITLHDLRSALEEVGFLIQSVSFDYGLSVAEDARFYALTCRRLS